ncbi:C-type lectin domain family 10 member A-like isoform X2 [Centroberyx gerrardi]
MNRKAQEPAVIFKNPRVSLSADESSPSCFQSSLLIAVCWVILVGIMAPRIYFTSVISEINAELRENQTGSAAACGILENRNTNLTTENLQLKTEKSDLERRIENMTRERNELNLTRAQWSLDAYCPKKGSSQERQCGPCQEGWIHSPSQSSCYVIVNPDSSGQRTWEEARDDCRGKNSDLVIIGSPEEQELIYEHSWGITDETSGYWIGLRNASGSWKWVDGSDLTEEYWIKPPSANAHCAISLQKTLEKPKGWKAVDCTERNRWICEMNALSV